GGHTAAGAPGPVGGGLRGRTRPRDGAGRACAPADDHARPGGGVPGLLRPCRPPVLPLLAHLSGLRSSPRPGLGATGHPAVGSPRSVSRTTTAHHGLWRSLVAHLTGGQGVYPSWSAQKLNIGMWRSLVAHLTGGQGVAGSNPVIPTKKPW